MGKAKKGKGMIFVVMIGIVLIVFAVLSFSFYGEYSRKTTSNGDNITIEIAKGTSTKGIANILKNEGIIKYTQTFLLTLKQSGKSGKLQYGTFEVNKGMSLEEIINIMCTRGAKRETVQITVPEGYSVQQIAALLEEKGVCTAEEFKNAVNTEQFNYEFLTGIPEVVHYKLQGFLLPNTYEVYPNATPRQIIEIMLNEFNKQYTAEYKALAQNLNKSIYEIITLASLVEREAKIDEERATIAGVLNNRLNINMKLQIDATVQYAISDGLFNVTRIFYKDLEYDSLYNVYKYTGLPIGPICNPGNQSILAVLNPEHHKYLYYRRIEGDNTGKHQFTETYEEHLE